MKQPKLQLLAWTTSHAELQGALLFPEEPQSHFLPQLVKGERGSKEAPLLGHLTVVSFSLADALQTLFLHARVCSTADSCLNYFV